MILSHPLTLTRTLHTSHALVAFFFFGPVFRSQRAAPEAFLSQPTANRSTIFVRKHVSETEDLYSIPDLNDSILNGSILIGIE